MMKKEISSNQKKEKTELKKALDALNFISHRIKKEMKNKK